MLLNYDSIKTETNCPFDSTAFTINKSPIAFDILSSKLYSNSHLAIVRELLTNAYDSQLLNGNPNTPIDIKFPTIADTEFSIRDYGVGMSNEDIMTLYTSFFSSTKSNSNDFTGCFGLGSKTPFAYTNIFNITSYFNGMCYVYIATKKDGYPSIINLSSTKTNEPNGLKISFTTNSTNDSSGYDNRFFNEFLDYIIFIPEIKVNINSTLLSIYNNCRNNLIPIVTKNNTTLYTINDVIKNNSHQNKFYFYIKQGQNIYKVNDFLNTNENEDLINEIILPYLQYIGPIITEVPIGTLEILPNRENLHSNDNNLQIISNLITPITNLIENNYSDIIYLSTTFFEKYLNRTYLTSDKNIFKVSSDYYGNSLRFTFNYSNLRSFSIISLESSYNSEYSRGSNISYTINKEIINNKVKFIPKNNKLLILLSYQSSNRRNSFTNSKTIHKIKTTLQNYNLNNDYTTYIMDYSYSNYSYDNVQILENTKFILNSFKQINTIASLGLNITYMSIKKFLKLYPTKKQSTIKSYTLENKRIRYKYKSFYTLNSTGYDNVDYIDNIKTEFIPEKTLIIETSTYDSTHYYNLQGFFELTYSLKTYNILNNYLNKYHLKKLNLINEIKLNMDKDFQSINLIVVNKSNIKYFKKEYIILSFEDLYHYIFKDTQKYHISFKNLYNNTHSLEILKNTILYNFKNIINKKQITILNKLLSKIDNAILYNENLLTKYIYVEEYKYNRLIRIFENKFIILNSVKSFKNLDCLKAITKYKSIKNFNGNGKEYYSLNSYEKTELLNDLRKENKNVLFFNR